MKYQLCYTRKIGPTVKYMEALNLDITGMMFKTLHRWNELDQRSTQIRLRSLWRFVLKTKNNSKKYGGIYLLTLSVMRRNSSQVWISICINSWACGPCQMTSAGDACSVVLKSSPSKQNPSWSQVTWDLRIFEVSIKRSETTHLKEVTALEV